MTEHLMDLFVLYMITTMDRNRTAFQIENGYNRVGKIDKNYHFHKLYIFSHADFTKNIPKRFQKIPTCSRIN